MEHQEDPCGSLPKTHLSMDLVYCAHHQAWTLTSLAYAETPTITVDVASSTVVRFGPFDGLEDVLRVAQACLEALLAIDPA